MSEESTSTEPETDLAAVEDTKASEAAQLAAEQAKLGKKFRIIAGEEILLTKRPSTFAFLNLYLLGFAGLGHPRYVRNQTRDRKREFHCRPSRNHPLYQRHLRLDCSYALHNMDEPFDECLHLGSLGDSRAADCLLGSIHCSG